jgi:hypothetical protein
MKKKIGKALITLAQVATWIGIIAIVTLSLVPAVDRPVTGAGQSPEHLTAFAIVGGVFAFGYRLSLTLQLVLAALLCGGIELLQIPLSTRHARVSDFLADISGAFLAIIFVFIARRLSAKAAA